MRSPVLLALAALALQASPAAAAGVEVGGPEGVVRCLRATGAPGQLLLQAPAARRFATDVRDAGRVTGTVRLGAQTACAEGAAGGRLLVVAPVARGDAREKGRQELRAAFGPGAPVVALTGPTAHLRSIEGLHVAVGPAGQAAVSWTERTFDEDATGADTHVRLRLRLALADPGRPLGVAVTLGSGRGSQAEGSTAVAYGPDGALAVVAGLPRPAIRDGATTTDALQRLVLRAAAPGGALGAPVVLDAERRGPTLPAVALAADGAILVAADGADRLTAWSRATAGAPFRRVLTASEAFPGEPRPATPDGERDVTTDAAPRAPAVVVAPGGQGAVAWSGRDGSLQAVTFAAGGAARPARTVLEGRSTGGRLERALFFGPGRGPAPIAELPDPTPSLALGADGRLALAAVRDRPRGPVLAVGAAGSLAGGLGPASRLTGPARSALRAVASLDPGGEPVAVVADEDGELVDGTRHPHGRLTAERLGVPAIAAPAPAARLLPPLRGIVRGGRSFRVRVRCAAACDVRAEVASRGLPVVAGDSLRRPGVVTLSLAQPDPRGAARRVRLPVTVVVAAPGGRSGRALRTAFRLDRLAPTPPPVVRELRVRRTGRAAVVTFSAPGGLRDYVVVAYADGPAVGQPVRARRVGPHRYRVVVPLSRAARNVLLGGDSGDLGDAPLERRIRLPAR